MVLIILATLLILGIAFYQSVQGCFSALIMAILTVLCAAVAFNFYEPLGDLLADRLGECAHPVALLAMFVLPLLVLRILFDRIIAGNVVMGMWVDRIGGGVLGLISGMVLTGMFMIVFQLLPMPAAMITYRPYSSDLTAEHGGPARWSGKFTLALAGYLSAGPLKAIGGGREFTDLHDDLLLEAFCLRNRPPGARASTPTDALKIDGAFFVQDPSKERLAKLLPVERDKLKANITRIQDTAPSYPLLSMRQSEEAKILAVRVKVDQSARNEDDNWFRLPATHFRLVCKSGRSFYPVGYLTYVGAWRVNTVVSDRGRTQVADILVVRPWKSRGGPEKLIVDWLYRLPPGEKASYMVFRRTAKASMPPVIAGLPAHEDSRRVQLALSVMPVSGKVKFESAGASRRLFQPELIEIDDRLPERMRLRSKEEDRPAAIRLMEPEGGTIRSAVVWGPVSDLKKTRTSKAKHLSRLHVRGGNNRIFHVHCKVNRKAAGAGIRNLLPRMKPRLLLEDGIGIPCIGAYLFYDRGGKRYVHLCYGTGQSAGRFDPDFARTFLANIAGAEVFGLYFVVPAAGDRSIVALTFLSKNDPAYAEYEFHTTAPLASGRKRRR